jgi:uncharacterized protein
MFPLNLAKIRSPHERFERVFAPGEFPAEPDFRVVAPVSLAFDIYKSNERFRLAGRVDTTLELPCSRCLESMPLPVSAAFELRYQPHTDNTGEGEREIEEDDLTTAFYENDTIDLGQLMHEQFYLALPMKPLCREDCRGLCPVCGINRNLNECSCATGWEDPRFAALRALKNKEPH